MISIYERILQQKTWNCSSESFKSKLDPKPQRDKCYPYAGVIYIAEDAAPIVIGADSLTNWDSSSNTTSKYRLYPRTLRSLKLKVDVDTNSPDTGLSDLDPPMPPQEEMYPVFVEKFSNLTFREVNHELMVSNPMLVNFPDPAKNIMEDPEKHLANGTPIKGEILAVTCYLEIVPNGGLRITQLWSDNYLGTPPVCP